MFALTVPRHLLATLALTGAAVGLAFALPVPARAAGPTLAATAQQTRPPGPGAGVRRPLQPFTVLRLDGPLDVEARPGAEPAATVYAAGDLAALVETVVEGDTLRVRLRPGTSWRARAPLKVEVEFGPLAATQQRGSGDLRIRGIAGTSLDSVVTGSGDLRVEDAHLGRLSVRIEGSGDVSVDGQADDARFLVAGSGDVAAANLAARRVLVEIDGSGDAHVDATDALDAHIAGSGTITYRGHPRDVNRFVAGSGSIEPER